MLGMVEKSGALTQVEKKGSRASPFARGDPLGSYASFSSSSSNIYGQLESSYRSIFFNPLPEIHIFSLFFIVFFKFFYRNNKSIRALDVCEFGKILIPVYLKKVIRLKSTTNVFSFIFRQTQAGRQAAPRGSRSGREVLDASWQSEENFRGIGESPFSTTGGGEGERKK